MFKVVGYYQALSLGSDFWVVVSNPKDFWFKKINWQSRLILQDIKAHQDILDPLLVPTAHLFPNKFIVCLPKKTKNLAEVIYNQWKGFQKPSLRIFLSHSISKKELENVWPNEDLVHDLSCVEISNHGVKNG